MTARIFCYNVCTVLLNPNPSNRLRARKRGKMYETVNMFAMLAGLVLWVLLHIRSNYDKFRRSRNQVRFTAYLWVVATLVGAGVFSVNLLLNHLSAIDVIFWSILILFCVFNTREWFRNSQKTDEDLLKEAWARLRRKEFATQDEMKQLEEQLKERQQDKVARK